MTDIPALVHELTAAQRLAMLEYCSCGKAGELVALGLWEPEFDFPSEYYLTTPLGKQVRAALKGATDG